VLLADAEPAVAAQGVLNQATGVGCPISEANGCLRGSRSGREKIAVAASRVGHGPGTAH